MGLSNFQMSKPNPDDYEYVEVEVDEEEEEEENQDENEIEVDTAQGARIGTHTKKEKTIQSFADLAVFNRNSQKLEEESRARGENIPLTLVFPDKKTQVVNIPANQTVEYLKSIIETKYGIDYSKMVC